MPSKHQRISPQSRVGGTMARNVVFLYLLFVYYFIFVSFLRWIITFSITQFILGRYIAFVNMFDFVNCLAIVGPNNRHSNV